MKKGIIIKTPDQIKLMHEGGNISSQALLATLESVKPGITLIELDAIAEKKILSLGGKPSFKMVDDYKFTTCININEGIVHGLPNNYVVKEGDLVSIDLGAFYKGFHTDLSYTVEVGTSKEEKFLNTGKSALEKAIQACVVGNTVGDVSNAMQVEIERAGYTVSRDLVGHGVGRDLHESPYVPCYGHKGRGVLLKEGMVLAIEAIYQKGRPELALDADGWTLKTLDGSLSSLFEKTVAITSQGPLVLTNY